MPASGAYIRKVNKMYIYRRVKEMAEKKEDRQKRIRKEISLQNVYTIHWLK